MLLVKTLDHPISTLSELYLDIMDSGSSHPLQLGPTGWNKRLALVALDQAQ